MKLIRCLSLAALIACLLSACQSRLIAEAVTQPGDVLFKDDFSDTTGGWAWTASTNGVMGFHSGNFRFVVNTVNYDLWTTPGKDFRDARIEVDAARLAGPAENRFGLICRYQGGQDFYFFIISSDGYYAIGKVKGGQRTLLGQESMAFNAAIQTGQIPNHLRADCVGAALTMYVNGMPVAVAQDTDFPTGDVGMLAGAFDTPGVDVLFDNFVVIKP